ncbi:MAG: tetratricopeptide repeat protein, partial [Planctomycetota bacterium]|nr:tetratricopeptide repeat protein [Planctomycetota bacterium]
GMPAYGVLDVGKLAQDGAAELARAKAAFIAVGVGRAVDALALSELARRTGGFYRPLRVDEGLDEAAFLLALSLQTPVLEAPALECGALTAICPENLGALLPGQEVFLHARAKTPLSEKLKLAVRGTLAGGDYARQFEVAWPANMAADPAVGRFWARAWLDHLLSQPQTRELRRQAIDLAQTWTLMSPYTSFLVLESEGEYARYGIDRRKRRDIWEEIEDEASFARRAEAAKLPAAVRERETKQFLQRISTLTKQTKELLDGKDFKATEQLATRILKMDPLNREVEELQRKAREAGLEAARPAAEAKAEEPWKQEVRKKLEKRVSFEFADTPLEDALKFLNSTTNTAIVLDPKVTAEGINRTPIRLRVQDMEADLALKWLLRLADLRYELRNQAVFVSRPENLAESVELRIYDVSDLTGTIQDFPGPRIDIGKQQETGVAPAARTGKGDATQTEIDAPRADLERDRQKDVKKFTEAAYKEQFTLARERAERMNIPHSDYLVYPDNWKDITQRPSGKDASQAEVDALKADVERLRQQIRLRGGADRKENAPELRSSWYAGTGYKLSDGRSGRLGRDAYVADNDNDGRSLDETFAGRYGPNAAVTTRNGKLTVGGLMQAWYYSVQDELAWDRRDDNDGRGEASDEFRRSSQPIEVASISYARDISYPANWDKISRRAEAGRQGKEEAWQGEIRKKLQRKVSFEFVDKPFDEAVASLRTMATVVIIVDPQVPQDKRPKLTLRVTDMSLDLALEWLVKLADLDYTLRDNAVFIGTPAAVASAVESRNYRLADLAEAIKKDVKPASWDDMTTSIEENGGKLVVMQRPEMHEAIAKMLEELRARKKVVDAAVARASSPVAGLRVPPTTAETKGNTVAVELTREQVAQLLAGTPKTPAYAVTRADLMRKLATLSEGIAGYRVLAEGIAEFGGAGPQAELLARELLIRVYRESNAVTLESAAEVVQDGSLRARIFARRATLETDAGKRLALWERAYAESDKDFAFLKPLCDSLHAAGKGKEVVTHLEAALRQGVSQPWMWQSLTQAYTACGDSAGALRALTQAVALRPREAEPRRQLAAALEASGRPKEALEQLRAACEFSPDVAALHRELLALATKHKDSAAREWVVLAMVNRDWQPNEGDVCGEANRQLSELIAECRRSGNEEKAKELERKQALANALDAVIVMSWDTDNTDVDLHVIEPHDHVSYQSKRSFQGGTLDRDVTRGFGPETYTLRHGAPGEYVVKVSYFSGGAPTNVQVKATFKKGSPAEHTETRAVQLKTQKEEVEVLRFKL